AVLLLAMAVPAAGIQSSGKLGAADTCPVANQTARTQTVYLPNITKTLGGATGWVTPFIVQNTGTIGTTLEVSFYKFSDGSCVARRTVLLLAPGTSFADVPNNDADLPGDTQFSVDVTRFGATQPLAVVVNTHNDDPSVDKPVAYATDGIAAGAESIYGPYAAKNANDAGFTGTTSTIVVQNLGSGAATPTIGFRQLGGATLTTFTGPSVASAAAWVFDPRYQNGVAGGTLCGTAASPGC